MSSPSAPDASTAAPAPEAADAAALEMADLVTAIFRMLDDNIDAVVGAGGLASSRISFDSPAAPRPTGFAPETHAAVPLVGVAQGGFAGHGPTPHG